MGGVLLKHKPGALVRVSDSKTNGKLDLWAGGKLAVITKEHSAVGEGANCWSIRVQGTKGIQHSYYGRELTVLAYDQEHLLGEWELEELLLGETNETRVHSK